MSSGDGAEKNLHMQPSSNKFSDRRSVNLKSNLRSRENKTEYITNMQRGGRVSMLGISEADDSVPQFLHLKSGKFSAWLLW